MRNAKARPEKSITGLLLIWFIPIKKEKEKL
jgi:hypothetical protein